MNHLTQFQKTMSSLEIAELTNKRHDHVVADIRKMIDDLNLHAPDFSGTQNYGNNNTREIFNLPKRETLILISGYSIELRSKIIDRWEELELEANKPKSLEEMSLLVINGLTAKVEEQRQALEQAQPKIEFHDAVTSSEKCFTMSEAVKLLNLTLGRNKFFMLLRAEKILNHDNEPYQQYIDQNYFRLTLKHVGHGGTEKVPLVTGKGLAWLQKRYDHIRLKEVV